MRDPVLPLWLFYYGAGAVLIVSFVALGALWRRPLLRERARGRPLPPSLEGILLSPALRVVLGAISVALLVLVFAAAAFGDDRPDTNIAPPFVWTLFWLGLVPVVVLIGNVWPVLNPWKAVADAAARVVRGWRAPVDYPERLGVWPAAVLLFLFATLELAYPDPSRPRVLAVAIAVYSWITWLGAATVGREAWFRSCDAFSVYFGLLARLAPFARRDDGRLVARVPLSGLAGRDERPGTVAFLAVMLGSVAFDGGSRTPWWQDRIFAIESSFDITDTLRSDLAVTAFNLAGLLGATLAVALIYLLAVEGARVAAKRRESMTEEFVPSLVPIALAYAVAHYFTLLIFGGQSAWQIASDPFGRGWDVFGTVGTEPRIDLLSPNTIWYVQVAALVLGHVLGLALAHDRAVELFRAPRTALRTQYAMLVLMVAYTVGGLWLLSNG